MSRRFEILCIYLTGLLQGLVLVIVPAASLIFTDPKIFGFSNAQYGLLFIPQVLAAIITSLLGPAIARRWGIRTALRAGLLFNILAAGSIGASQWVWQDHSMAYLWVIAGTSLVGAAFGTTLPVINVYAVNFFPKNSASALTALHTLLGLGTALAPFLVAVLVKHGGWWMLPLGVTVVLIVLLTAALILPLQDQRPPAVKAAARAESRSLWRLRVGMFAGAVFLYGYCETLFANWAVIFLNRQKGMTLQEAGYALTAFWIMVSLGRLLVSLLSFLVPARVVYKILPVFITLALAGVSTVSSSSAGIRWFALAGLSCSAFFPLSFNFGQKSFTPLAERISGWLMASYMAGYGVAAYGIGKIIETTSLSLKVLYFDSTLIGAGIILLSFLLMAPETRAV